MKSRHPRDPHPRTASNLPPRRRMQWHDMMANMQHRNSRVFFYIVSIFLPKFFFLSSSHLPGKKPVTLVHDDISDGYFAFKFHKPLFVGAGINTICSYYIFCLVSRSWSISSCNYLRFVFFFQLYWSYWSQSGLSCFLWTSMRFTNIKLFY